jgi:hypothetical protein
MVTKCKECGQPLNLRSIVQIREGKHPGPMTCNVALKARIASLEADLWRVNNWSTRAAIRMQVANSTEPEDTDIRRAELDAALRLVIGIAKLTKSKEATDEPND